MAFFLFKSKIKLDKYKHIVYVFALLVHVRYIRAAWGHPY